MKIFQRLKTSWKLVLVFIAISIYIGFTLHTHTDEFILFSDLEYEQPNFYLNQFTNGYNAFIKIFPFDWKVYLPFNYLGNLQGILFYPFYKTLPIELAKLSYSFLSLIVIYILINQAFKLTEIKRWIIIVFIPLYVCVLHDSGPVNLAIISFFISKFLIERFYQSNNIIQKIWPLGALALTWILGFYDKQFYLYLFPSVLIFSIANISWESLISYKTLLLSLPIGFFILFVIIFLWGDSQIQIYHLSESFPYRLQTKKLLGGASDLEPLVELIRYFPSSIEDWPRLTFFFEDRLFSLGRWINNFNFSYYLERNLNSDLFINPRFKTRIPISFFLFVIFIGTLSIRFFSKVAKRGIKESELKPILYFLSFTIMSLGFFILGKVRAPHHFIFLWIPIWGLILDNPYQLHKSKTFLLFYITSLGLCIINLSSGKANTLIKENYQTVAAYTQRESKELRIINFDGWNHGITRKLDNPNHHIVTLVDPRNTAQFNRLIALARKLDVPIIEVSNQTDWGYPTSMSPDKKMNIFRAAGFKVKQLNKSKAIPVYLITINK